MKFQEQKYPIDNNQGRELPISSSNTHNVNKNGLNRNRPKFTYHKVPGFAAESLYDKPTFDTSSIDKQVGTSFLQDSAIVDDTALDGPHVGYLRSNSHGDQRSITKRNDGTRRIYGNIKTSFRYSNY